MRIALLFPMDSPVVSWNCGRGIERTLQRMGIEVMAIPLPTSATTDKRLFESVKASVPPIEHIKHCDGVIVSGPEHIGPWVEAIYERYEWRQLEIPTVAWLHESMDRDDYNIDFEAIEWMGADWFFPAIQDAEKHDQEMFKKDHSHYLPFGVDEEIFREPAVKWSHETFDVAFMGMMYPKRVAWLNSLSRHDHPPIRMGSAHIQDLHGYDMEGSVKRYAANLREIKVFINLPALSRLLVTKVYEVLACGGFLMTPMLPPEGGIGYNMKLFESGKHLLYYRPSNMPNNANMLRDWSSREKDEERRVIAAAGCAEVHAHHRIRNRLEVMFEKMGLETRVKQAVQ